MFGWLPVGVVTSLTLALHGKAFQLTCAARAAILVKESQDSSLCQTKQRKGMFDGTCIKSEEKGET